MRKGLVCLGICLCALLACSVAWGQPAVLPDFGVYAAVEPIGEAALPDGSGHLYTFEAKSLDKVNAFVREVEREFGFLIDREKVDGGEIIRLEHAYLPGFSITYQRMQKLAVFLYPADTVPGDFDAVADSIHGTVEYAFADSTLEWMIRSEIGIEEGPITRAQLAELKELDLYGFEHRDRKGILDFSDLAALTGLETLSLKHSPITSLEPLAGLTRLQLLELDGCEVTDFRPLAGLSELRRLTFAFTPVKSLKGLGKLVNLEEISAHKAQLTSVDDLATMVGLQMIWISGNQVKTLPNLSKLTALDTLSITDNQISDLSGLRGATALEYLAAENNNIKNISPLIKLENLRTARLRGNPITSTKELANKEGNWLTLEPNVVLATTSLGGGKIGFAPKDPPFELDYSKNATFEFANVTPFIGMDHAGSQTMALADASLQLRPMATYRITMDASFVPGSPSRATPVADMEVTVPSDKCRSHGWSASKTGIFLLPAGAEMDGFLDSFRSGTLSDLSAARLTRSQIKEIADGKQALYAISNVTLTDDSHWNPSSQFMLQLPDGSQLWIEDYSYTLSGNTAWTIYSGLSDLIVALRNQEGSQVPLGKYTVNIFLEYELAISTAFEVRP